MLSQRGNGQSDIAQHVGLKPKIKGGAGQIMVPHEIAN
jgi:hypothetical protein